MVNSWRGRYIAGATVRNHFKLVVVDGNGWQVTFTWNIEHASLLPLFIKSCNSVGKSINDVVGANRFHMPLCSLCMSVTSGAETGTTTTCP